MPWPRAALHGHGRHPPPATHIWVAGRGDALGACTREGKRLESRNPPTSHNHRYSLYTPVQCTTKLQAAYSRYLSATELYLQL